MTLFSVIGLIGGLTFFLFGMNVMSGSLEKMAGGKLELLLKKMTANPFISLVLGMVITIAVQSSSATTVMLVGLVNSGLMKLSQTLFVIYGANIGTTITSWILSLSGIQSDNIGLQMLKPENFSPIVALIGILMLMLSHNDRKKSIGTVFVGFAVLIYGMKMMSDAVSPLADSPGFAAMLTKFNIPLVGMLIGTLFTGVIQSSAATIGILQALSMTGSLTNAMIIPVVMGANIGTCATSLISCIGTNRKAKQVAVIHVGIKIIGTAVWLTVFSIVNSLVSWSYFEAAASPVSIAVAHSAFNILTTILLMPFTKWLEKGVKWLIPDKKSGARSNELFLDERLLKSPSVAVTESNNATGKMCRLAQQNVLMAMELFHHFDEKQVAIIRDNEETLDSDEDKLSTYLVQLSAQALSQADSLVVSKMLHAIGDFERLGDHALNLMKVAREIRDKEIQFTEDAHKELRVLTDAIREILELTSRAYIENDLTLAAQVEPLEQVIDGLTSRIRGNHIERLRTGNCTIEMGFILSDLLTNYERISDHCSNVAVAIIEVEHNSFDTHKYLNGVKSGNEQFDDCYEKYRTKYAIG